MRDAQSLADQAIAYGSGRIEEAAVRQMLGAVDRSHAARCIEAAAARDGAALLGAVDGLRELGLSAAGALEEMAALLQEMAIVQAVPGALADDDPDSEVARRLAALLPADETQLLYSMVLAGRAEIALAPDEYSGLVMVLLRMLAFAPADGRATPTAPPTPVPAPAAVPRATASAAAAALGACVGCTACAHAWRQRRRWRQCGDADSVAGRDGAYRCRRCRATIRRRHRSTARAPPTSGPSSSSASPPPAPSPRWCASSRCRRNASASSTARSGRLWQLRVERENLRTPALRERLQAALAQAEGRAERIEIEAGAVADTPAARDAAERDRRQAEAERVIQDDPLVKALMAQYKTARIVPGSVRPPPAATP